MKRKIGIFFVFMILIILLTGCWNRVELNELAIVAMLGFDKSGEEYVVSAQIINPGEVAASKGGGTRSPAVTYTSKGDTVFEALRRMTTKSPRKAYLSHLRMIVIGEEMAKEGIGKPLDFLSRDHEIRTDFFLVVAKEMTAKQVLTHFTSLEKIPANHLFSSLEKSTKIWAGSGKVTLDQLINDIVAEGKQPVLTGIRIVGDEEKSKDIENTETLDPAEVQYFGMAAFNKDKLIGWLNETDSKIFNFIQGEVKNTVMEIDCPKGGKLAVEIVRTNVKVKGKTDNGRPKAEVELRAEGNVGDVDCVIDLTKTKTIYELEKLVEIDIKNKADKTIKKVQETYRVDIFGFGEAIHRSEPKVWKELKKDWDKEFVDLPVNVKVDVKIRRLGTISQSFIEKLKE